MDPVGSAEHTLGTIVLSQLLVFFQRNHKCTFPKKVVDGRIFI